jgi:hypothetical protein
MTTDSVYISCIVPQSIHSQIEAWRSRAAHSAGGPVSRSTALRLMILRGLEALTAGLDDQDDGGPTARTGDKIQGVATSI